VRRDDRAVSTALTQVLVLGISTVLVVGLVVAVGGFISDQRDRAFRDGATALGEQVASAAAEVSQTDGDRQLSVSLRLQSRIATQSYEITLTSGPACPADACVVVRGTGTSDVSVTVQTALDGPVNETTVRGGTIVVSDDGGGVGLREGRL
jgi:hypothetical protein